MDSSLPPPPIRALILTKTHLSYRHACIPTFIRAVASLPNIEVLATEDSSVLLQDDLLRYDVLIFGHNTGNWLSDEELDAVKTFVQSSMQKGWRKGVVGVHAATAGMHDAPWYGDLLGASFDGHPEPQWGVLTVRDTEHFITRSLPRPTPAHAPAEAPPCPEVFSLKAGAENMYTRPVYTWFDEWYNFRPGRTLPPPGGTVLCSVDEDTYTGGKHGDDHALAWCHEIDQHARVFYTSLGHFDEAYEDPWFMGMLERAIQWVAGRDIPIKVWMVL